MGRFKTGEERINKIIRVKAAKKAARKPLAQIQLPKEAPTATEVKPPGVVE